MNRLLICLTAAALLVLGGMPACRGGGSDMPQEDIHTVMKAHADELMAVDGVAAVAVSASEDGTPCIKVYVVELSDTIEARIPKRLGGYPVVVEESGTFRPMGEGG